MVWSNEKVEHLIQLMEIHRCLWDSTDINRKKKGKINEAHDIIGEELEIDTKDVKKKINSLRSQMSAERAKVAKGGKNGAGGDEIYKPKWEYYNSLLFLFNGESKMHQQKVPQHSLSKKQKQKFEEDKLIEKCIATITAPPLFPPEKKVKTRAMALVDSIGALLFEMEKEDENLLMEFSKTLRRTLNEFEDRFDEKKKHNICAK